MRTRTKIICTIGPACSSYEKIKELIEAGMNVARLNMSHGDQEKHAEAIENIKRARDALKCSVAIMLDTRGPEVRIGKIKGGEIVLSSGTKWTLVKDEVEGDYEKVTITPSTVLDNLVEGTRVLFDDGYLSSRVVNITSEGVVVEIETGGHITSSKGVNVPDRSLNLPAITEKDKDDIHFGCQHGIDLIAASFVRSPDNIMTIRKLLKKEGREDVLIIAKIENHEGVNNFDSIIQVADGVMIARGDLGVEVPLSQVPRLQKEMIRKSNLTGKISVTATQMLESMIRNPRPTRAEVSDVANAIYDSTSAVMLSGETAVGRYPIQAVSVMKSIIQEAESDFDYRSFFELHSKFTYKDVPSAVTLATVKTAYSSHAKAIFSFTSSGLSPRLLARLHPEMPIVAMTPKKSCYNQLAIVWGVIPYFENGSDSVLEAFPKISSFSLLEGIVDYGDLVVLTAGSPFGVAGTTNMMVVENIGKVLVRGHLGLGKRVQGEVKILLSSEGKTPAEFHDKLIVMTQCDETYIPFMNASKGIILQNNIEDQESEYFAVDYSKEVNKPLIVRADGAISALKDGQTVTLEPDKALVCQRTDLS